MWNSNVLYHSTSCALTWFRNVVQMWACKCVPCTCVCVYGIRFECRRWNVTHTWTWFYFLNSRIQASMQCGRNWLRCGQIYRIINVHRAATSLTLEWHINHDRLLNAAFCKPIFSAVFFKTFQLFFFCLTWMERFIFVVAVLSSGEYFYFYSHTHQPPSRTLNTWKRSFWTSNT